MAIIVFAILRDARAIVALSDELSPGATGAAGFGGLELCWIKPAKGGSGGSIVTGQQVFAIQPVNIAGAVKARRSAARVTLPSVSFSNLKGLRACMYNHSQSKVEMRNFRNFYIISNTHN